MVITFFEILQFLSHSFEVSKYFVHDCLWKSVFANNSFQTPWKSKFWINFNTLGSFSLVKHKIWREKLLKPLKNCIFKKHTFLHFEFSQNFMLRNILSLWGVIFLRNIGFSFLNMTNLVKFNYRKRRNLKKKCFPDNPGQKFWDFYGILSKNNFTTSRKTLNRHW